jgi:hypothetical protein
MERRLATPYPATRRRFLAHAGAAAAALTLTRYLDLAHANESGSSATISRGLSGDWANLAASDPRSSQIAFEAAVGGGAATVRFPVSWASLERDWEAYDWTPLEALHADIAWHGVQAVPVLCDPPPWLEDCSLDASGNRYPSGHFALNRYAAFVSALTQRLEEFGDNFSTLEAWDLTSGGVSSSVARVIAENAELSTATSIGRQGSVSVGCVSTTSSDWGSYLGDVASPAVAAVGVRVDPEYGVSTWRSDVARTVGDALAVVPNLLRVLLVLPVGVPPTEIRGAVADLTATSGVAAIDIEPVHRLLSPGVQGSDVFGPDWAPTDEGVAVWEGWA